jgi:malate dehydrogenase (oxaloacetate-decarboxylating)
MPHAGTQREAFGYRQLMARLTPSAGTSLNLRVRLTDIPGSLGKFATAVGECGGDIRTVDLVQLDEASSDWDFWVYCADSDHTDELLQVIDSLDNAELLSSDDRTFLLHEGGKLEIRSKLALRNRDDLAMAYTPGVGRVSSAIAEDLEKVWTYTGRGNAVAVVTDGSAVLGLGDIGPEAALPVMEGKAILFKAFANIDAYPICLRARDPEKIIAAVEAISPTFGGINLEDISAPRCFEIEETLTTRLPIPVFHDDQHGTAIVTLAALHNALKVTDRRMEDCRVVILGMGAAGIACGRLLLQAGVEDIIGADRAGVIHRGRTENMNPQKQWFAENTNLSGVTGGVEDALRGATVFLGVSGPGLVKSDWIAEMAPNPIVFAMANPIPEVMPEDIAAHVGVMATGRSDYPNQINNVLAFPGVFRGLLDVRAEVITDKAKLAAARALADVVPEEALSPRHIIASAFDPHVCPAVAAAVRGAVVSRNVPAGGRPLNGN